MEFTFGVNIRERCQAWQRETPGTMQRIAAAGSDLALAARLKGGGAGRKAESG